ncbi:MAG: hypothetical protein PGN08_05995 [Sphingomonas taxi]
MPARLSISRSRITAVVSSATWRCCIAATVRCTRGAARSRSAARAMPVSRSGVRVSSFGSSSQPSISWLMCAIVS